MLGDFIFKDLMEEKTKYREIPKVLVLASPEFYPEYQIAFTKLDTILKGLVEEYGNIIIATDIGLKATKLIDKYVEQRGFMSYSYVPNRMLEDWKWQNSIKTLIRKAVKYLIVFYYKDSREFQYAISECIKVGIGVRLVDLSKYEE